MTIFLVDVHEFVHTCPANRTVTHPVDTRHTLVSITDGGPCTQPAMISLGDDTAVIRCRLRVASDRQCPACRHTVWTRHTTITDLGYQHPTDTMPVPTGYAADPCPYCRTPVAAILGSHLLCGPVRQDHV